MSSPSARSIKVLVSDFSGRAESLVGRALEAGGDLEVVGVARTKSAAVNRSVTLAPDVVAVDLALPDLAGLEAVEEIMQLRPTPILALTRPAGLAVPMEGYCALERGALDWIAEPASEQAAASWALALRRKLRMLSRLAPIPHADRLEPTARAFPTRSFELVGVVGSAGAPTLVRRIVAALGRRSPPLLVVQHRVDGSGNRFAEWLAAGASVPVALADPGVEPLPGHVYVARDDVHLVVERRGRSLVLASSEVPAVEGHRPAGTLLFDSMARHVGTGAVGVLLSGMGRDGAAGLLLLRGAGATTVVQSKASCLVYGMPGAAARLGAVQHELAVESLLEHLAALVWGAERVGQRSTPVRFS